MLLSVSSVHLLGRLYGDVPSDVINVYQPPGIDICITFKSSLMRGRFRSTPPSRPDPRGAMASSSRSPLAPAAAEEALAAAVCGGRLSPPRPAPTFIRLGAGKPPQNHVLSAALVLPEPLKLLAADAGDAPTRSAGSARACCRAPAGRPEPSVPAVELPPVRLWRSSCPRARGGAPACAAAADGGGGGVAACCSRTLGARARQGAAKNADSAALPLPERKEESRSTNSCSKLNTSSSWV